MIDYYLLLLLLHANANTYDGYIRTPRAHTYTILFINIDVRRTHAHTGFCGPQSKPTLDYRLTIILFIRILKYYYYFL